MLCVESLEFLVCLRLKILVKNLKIYVLKETVVILSYNQADVLVTKVCSSSNKANTLFSNKAIPVNKMSFGYNQDSRWTNAKHHITPRHQSCDSTICALTYTTFPTWHEGCNMSVVLNIVVSDSLSLSFIVCLQN